VLFPVQAYLIRKAFRVDEGHYRKSCERIESLLAETEADLADGRSSILGGGAVTYTDLAFAAIHGVWLQPAGYGGAAGIRIERASTPRAMREDIERWIEDYPRVTRFIERLYASERNEVPKP
jgi:glutathione S-transferase